jgi:TRAP-type C4-dicarboxylate transport system permease small subunit
MMNRIKRIFRLIMGIEIVAGAVLVISIVGIMVLEVIMRYIFNQSIIWVQEYIIMAFIWTVAFGASYALMGQSHITINTFSKYLPKKFEKFMRILVSLVILGVLGYLAATLPATIVIQNKTRTASLPVSVPKGYYYTLPLLISVWIMIPTQLYYLFFQFRAFLGFANPENYYIAGDIPISKKTEPEGV